MKDYEKKKEKKGLKKQQLDVKLLVEHLWEWFLVSKL